MCLIQLRHTCLHFLCRIWHISTVFRICAATLRHSARSFDNAAGAALMRMPNMTTTHASALAKRCAAVSLFACCAGTIRAPLSRPCAYPAPPVRAAPPRLRASSLCILGANKSGATLNKYMLKRITKQRSDIMKWYTSEVRALSKLHNQREQLRPAGRKTAMTRVKLAMPGLESARHS